MAFAPECDTLEIRAPKATITRIYDFFHKIGYPVYRPDPSRAYWYAQQVDSSTVRLLCSSPQPKAEIIAILYQLQTAGIVDLTDPDNPPPGVAIDFIV